jgi:murein L,D-transpeptidase YcbB/YkuD
MHNQRLNQCAVAQARPQAAEAMLEARRPGRATLLYFRGGMIIGLQCLALLAAAAMLLAAPTAWAESIPNQIRTLAADSARTARAATRLYDERDWLERFYAARDFAPVWSGPGAAQAAGALELLEAAPDHGLALPDYLPDALAQQIRAGGSPASDRAARFDTGLTMSLLRYLADLHAGRTRSGFLHAVPDPRVRDFDPVAALQRALAEQQLAAAIDAAEPQLAIYRRLKEALARYRKLASHPRPPLPALPAGRKAVDAGTYSGARLLSERLAVLGDLAPEFATTRDDRYGPELAGAVKRFQERHGIDPDGRIGRQTLLALGIPLSVRVRQIELSLERLRWLPDLSAGPVIAINLPSFRLWAFQNGAATSEPALEMRVIVGKALRTPTPLFVGEMRHLEFNPYWNVPRSIERGEILSKLMKDPDYLANNDMELVGARGEPSDTVNAATLAALRAGSLRIRQRPGAGNALGAVKFVLPNAMSIYLHSTPARALFQRSRRDFSHGCIRVEDPAALAAFVLADQPEWSPESIAAAMMPGATRTVRLATPVPVVIFYTTAFVDNKGRLIFPADVYQLDAALERALAARSGIKPSSLGMPAG